MARGWESKAVEERQAEAGSARLDRSELTAAERRAWQKRQSLELSRRRVLQEIETTRSEARRVSLEQALAFLDQQLDELGPALEPESGQVPAHG